MLWRYETGEDKEARVKKTAIITPEEARAACADISRKFDEAGGVVKHYSIIQSAREQYKLGRDLDQLSFVVCHYAEPVMYTSDTWLDKNRGVLNEELTTLMGGAGLGLEPVAQDLDLGPGTWGLEPGTWAWDLDLRPGTWDFGWWLDVDKGR